MTLVPAAAAFADAGPRSDAAAVTGRLPRPGGLRLEGIVHAFDGKPVLRGVGVSVNPGEVVCLLGPSGCGKSTLLRLTAGLERLQQGRIEIAGDIVADAASGCERPAEARRVGLMFQDFALFPHLTVFENVRFGIARSTRGDAWVRDALQRLGLAAWSDAYPHTLSGGQQQRCALLRALAPHPQLLLLDEPFSGLDVALRSQVREETAAFLRETGISTLVVTHDPEEAMILADRVAVMRDGRILQEGTPEDIYLRPRDPFVAGLFGALNRWHGRVTAGHVETPVASFAATGLAEGATAVVLIRPEAVHLDPEGHGGTVLASRLLGCLSAVSLSVDAGSWQLRALVPGAFLPKAGSRIGIAVDPARAWVFPAD